MKTQSTIKLNSKKNTIISLDDFLRQIFYSKNPEKLINIAEDILDIVAKKGLTDEDRDVLMQKHTDLTPKVYYNIIQRLKALGVIYKKGADVTKGTPAMYKPSKQFANSMRALANYWEAYSQSSGS